MILEIEKSKKPKNRKSKKNENSKNLKIDEPKFLDVGKLKNRKSQNNEKPKNRKIVYTKPEKTKNRKLKNLETDSYELMICAKTVYVSEIDN